jgi:hypothetical protein
MCCLRNMKMLYGLLHQDFLHSYTVSSIFTAVNIGTKLLYNIPKSLLVEEQADASLVQEYPEFYQSSKCIIPLTRNSHWTLN